MKTRWHDWITLIFGFWLLISPWWLQYFTGRPYTDQTAASWNSILFGIAVVYVAIWALAQPQKWEEWINLVLGVWLIASPWVLGFHAYTIATVNLVTVGLVIALFSLVGLGKLHHPPAAYR
jgi:hypothetical protein